jgi:hypothetical protein
LSGSRPDFPTIGSPTRAIDRNIGASMPTIVEQGAVPLFLRRGDAAQYLQNKFGIRCAKQTLAKLAVIGGGPKYHLAGRTPIYAPNDLDEYAMSKISGPRLSTSEEAVR